MRKQDMILDFQDAMREGYKDFLEELGFASYKDDLLHWYLLRNDVLFSLQTATLGTYANVNDVIMYPLIMAKPLFIKTPIPAPLSRCFCLGTDVFPGQIRWTMICRRARVSYPQGGRFGGVVVEKQLREILSVIQTPEDAFEQRKAYCKRHEKDYLSEDFVDEVIYYRDEEMWERAIDMQKLYFSYLSPDADLQKNPYAIRHGAQLRALQDPCARLEYVAELEEKKAAHLAELRKKVPAAIHSKPFFQPFQPPVKAETERQWVDLYRFVDQERSS